jgi:hypothetical protein
VAVVIARTTSSCQAHVVWSYDMVERGLAWQEVVVHLPAFGEVEKEIKARFRGL